MSGKHDGLGVIGNILDLGEFLDIFDSPVLILSVAALLVLIAFCVWLLRGAWALRPTGGAEVAR